MHRSIGLILAGALALGIATPSQASAQVDFGIALGARLGSLDLNTIGSGATGGSLAVGGLEGTIWFNDDVALDVGTYLGTVAVDGGDARFDIGLWAGVLYALMQADQTKFELGGRLGIHAAINSSGIPDANDDDAWIMGEVLFRIEHWFDNHFTIAGLVGLSIAGDPDDTLGFAAALGAQAGLTVTYYFGGTAAPGDGTVAPPAPAPAPAPYGGGGGGGGNAGGAPAGGGDTGGGEPLPDPESGAAGW
jgi:hypothetical protein